MEAVVSDGYGPPDVLRLEDVERPVPKEDEVLVKVHATTVNRLDCATREANRRSGLAVSFMSRLVFGLRRPKRRGPRPRLGCGGGAACAGAPHVAARGPG